MRNIDYHRAVLLGAVLGMTFFSLFYIMTPDTKNQPENEQVKSNFQVVDSYKGCDVIRWENNMLAEYKYFLHCASSQGGTQISQMP